MQDQMFDYVIKDIISYLESYSFKEIISVTWNIWKIEINN